MPAVTKPPRTLTFTSDALEELVSPLPEVEAVSTSAVTTPGTLAPTRDADCDPPDAGVTASATAAAAGPMTDTMPRNIEDPLSFDTRPIELVCRGRRPRSLLV